MSSLSCSLSNKECNSRKYRKPDIERLAERCNVALRQISGKLKSRKELCSDLVRRSRSRSPRSGSRSASTARAPIVVPSDDESEQLSSSSILLSECRIPAKQCNSRKLKKNDVVRLGERCGVDTTGENGKYLTKSDICSNLDNMYGEDSIQSSDSERQEELSRATYMKLSKAQLIALAAEMGIDKVGNRQIKYVKKIDIVDSIVASKLINEEQRASRRATEDDDDDTELESDAVDRASPLKRPRRTARRVIDDDDTELEFEPDDRTSPLKRPRRTARRVIDDDTELEFEPDENILDENKNSRRSKRTFPRFVNTTTESMESAQTYSPAPLPAYQPSFNSFSTSPTQTPSFVIPPTPRNISQSSFVIPPTPRNISQPSFEYSPTQIHQTLPLTPRFDTSFVIPRTPGNEVASSKKVMFKESPYVIPPPTFSQQSSPASSIYSMSQSSPSVSLTQSPSLASQFVPTPGRARTPARGSLSQQSSAQLTPVLRPNTFIPLPVQSQPRFVSSPEVQRPQFGSQISPIDRVASQTPITPLIGNTKSETTTPSDQRSASVSGSSSENTVRKLLFKPEYEPSQLPSDSRGVRSVSRNEIAALFEESKRQSQPVNAVQQKLMLLLGLA